MKNKFFIDKFVLAPKFEGRWQEWGDHYGEECRYKDVDGKSIVVINDLRFKGRRSVDWNIVEKCLKEYIGQCAEITETSDVVYIGADFPDEFAHSKDTKELRGTNMYAKANSSGIFAIPVYDDTGELVRYNVFKSRILVRHAEDGKLYLDDILRTKKETSKPLEQ